MSQSRPIDDHVDERARHESEFLSLLTEFVSQAAIWMAVAASRRLLAPLRSALARRPLHTSEPSGTVSQLFHVIRAPRD